MTNDQMNQVVENCPCVLRDISNFGCIVACEKAAEYIAAKVYTREIIDMFLSNPEAKTDKYQWETRRVDGMINTTIWRVK
jgi:hypothetical protein